MHLGADTARLFFALKPDPSLRRDLMAIQTMLGLSARTVPAARLHLTLAFLGEVAKDRIPQLLSIGSELELPACTLVLDRFGCFARAAVGWLGAGEPPAPLMSFQRMLIARLAQCGFAVDQRAWRPHLTLYRNLRTPRATMTIEPLGWNLNGYCLVHSRRAHDGRVYETLGRWAAMD